MERKHFRRIETVIFDGIASAIIGALFGMTIPAHSSRLHKHPVFYYACIVEALFIVAASICYYLNADWMWMYYYRGEEFPEYLLPVLVIVIYVLPFSAAFHIFVDMSPNLKRYIFLGILLTAQLALFIVMFDRYMLVTTTDNFAAHSGVRLYNSTIGTVLTIATVLLAPLGIYLLIKSKKVPSRRKGI